MSRFTIDRYPELAAAVRARDIQAIRRSLRALEATGEYNRDEPQLGLVHWTPRMGVVAYAAA